jgi:hypothetical protein
VQIHDEVSGQPPRNWGGRRVGAGRKAGPRPRVRHHTRPPFDGRFPALVTLRVLPWLPSLRSYGILRVWKAGLVVRDDFQVLDWTLQTDHLHLIAEANGAPAMESGMTGLASSFARRLNSLIGRVGGGRVFDHRHHRVELATVRALEAAIVYVHSNWKKHGHATWNASEHDPFASGKQHLRIIRRARTGIGRIAAARVLDF